jgi:hypothetical protein
MKALFPSIEVSGRRYRRKRGQKTGHFHEITCGLVKITQSCISIPDKVPREAKFRLTLATNGQGDLFEEPEPETEQAKYLYSILTYGINTESENRSLPAFVRIQFPNKTCTQYVDAGIDLMAKFPDIVAEYVPQPNAKAAVTQKPPQPKEASA